MKIYIFKVSHNLKISKRINVDGYIRVFRFIVCLKTVDVFESKWYESVVCLVKLFTKYYSFIDFRQQYTFFPTISNPLQCHIFKFVFFFLDNTTARN